MKKLVKNKIFQFLLVALFFLLVAIVFTYPLIKSISNYVPGWQPMNDSGEFVWNFWWVKKALFNFQNPFYTNYVYYPTNSNLGMHTLTIFLAILSIPIQLITKSPIVSFNIIFLFTFILTGFSTYLLILHLTENKYISLFGGFAFAFCPYVFGHVYTGHLNLIAVWTIPAFIYSFISFLEGNKKSIWYLSIILLIQTYTDFQYLLYIAIILVFLLLFFAIKRHKDFWPNTKKIIISSLIVIVLSLPILIPFFKFRKESSDYNQQVSQQEVTNHWHFNSTNLTHYISGNYLNPIFGKRLDINNLYQGGIRENLVFFGYLNIILAILGLFFVKHRYKWLFFTIGLVFFVFSLGNNLYYGQELLFKVKLPSYYLFDKLDTVVSRFSVITQLVIVILSSLFLKFIYKKISYKWLRYLILIIITLIFAIEYWVAPIDITPVNSSPYLKKIKTDTDVYNIVLLPTRLISQTMLDKPQIAGRLGRHEHEYYYNQSLATSLTGFDLLYYHPRDYSLNIDDFLYGAKKYQIKKVVIDKVEASEEELNFFSSICENDLKLEKIFEDDQLLVYNINYEKLN